MNILSKLAQLSFPILLSITIIPGSPSNAQIIPIDDLVAGKSYRQLTGEWWEWALSFPDFTSPILENGEVVLGTQKQNEDLWFLAGTFGTTANRTITIPLNEPPKTLFFPILNTLFWLPEDGPNEAAIRASANQSIDLYDFSQPDIFMNFSLDLSSDGQKELELDENTLQEFRAESPEGGQILRYDQGTFGGLFVDPNFNGPNDPGFAPRLSVADGYWLALQPLPKGTHTLEFQVQNPNLSNINGDEFALDVTYTIKSVNVPEPAFIFGLLFVAGLGLRIKNQKQSKLDL